MARRPAGLVSAQEATIKGSANSIKNSLQPTTEHRAGSEGGRNRARVVLKARLRRDGAG